MLAVKKNYLDTELIQIGEELSALGDEKSVQLIREGSIQGGLDKLKTEKDIYENNQKYDERDLAESTEELAMLRNRIDNSDSESEILELRPEVLGSWHKIIDKNEKTHNILGDIWRIASIKSIIQGRNIPLYQYNTVFSHLFQEEQQSLVKAIESAVPLWIVSQENPSFNFLFEVEGIRPIKFDIMTEKCAFYVFFDPLFVPDTEDKILLLLKQYAYEEMYDRSLESIGFVNIATGMVIQYEITSIIREQLSQMCLYIQTKYHL